MTAHTSEPSGEGSDDSASACGLHERRRSAVGTLTIVLHYIVALGLVAILLIVAVDAGKTTEHLALVDPGWLLLGLIALVASIAAASLRWLLLLRGLGCVPSFWSLMSLWLKGFFVDHLLPSNVGGDAARGYGLARGGVSAEATITSLLVGRILAFISLGAWGGIALISATIRASSVLSLPNLIGGLLGVSGVVAMVVVMHCGNREATEAPSPTSERRWFDKIRIMLHRLWCELCAYRGQTSLLLWCFAISMSMWLIDACILFSCIRGMAVEIPFGHVVGVNTTLNWAGVIPVSVGGAGVQEGTLVVLLREFSVTGSLAMAVGLSYRAVRLTVALLGGLMLLVAGFRSRTHPRPSESVSLRANPQERCL